MDIPIDEEFWKGRGFGPETSKLLALVPSRLTSPERESPSEVLKHEIETAQSVIEMTVLRNISCFYETRRKHVKIRRKRIPHAYRRANRRGG